MGADPIAYAVARASVDQPPLVQAFSVRKEAKGHGTRRQIEGNFFPGAKVVVIEDVITSGGSALRAIEAVRGAGGSVLGLLTLVDRAQGGRESIEASGINVVAITTTADLGV
jgi:orotate phosphoribosyltransferase